MMSKTLTKLFASRRPKGSLLSRAWKTYEAARLAEAKIQALRYLNGLDQSRLAGLGFTRAELEAQSRKVFG